MLYRRRHIRRLADGLTYRRLKGMISEEDYLAQLNQERTRHRLPKVTVEISRGPNRVK